MGRGVFARYWTAAALSSVGTSVTTVALPVLVVDVLHASAFQVGLVNALQLAPYALLGLPAGALVDRWRRQRVLVGAGFGRAACLACIPALHAAGELRLWSLAIVVFAFGSMSVFGFAATQSLLPSIVPKEQLLQANARLDQVDAAAQTAGPALGGAVVAAVGAAAAIVVDAVSYVVEAVLVAGLSIDETTRPRTGRRLRREIREGLGWTYRHGTLAWLALSTHVWFLANAAAMTVFATLALRVLHLSALVYGTVFAVAGLTTLAGASLAAAAGRRLGAGQAIAATRAAYPVAWLVIALAPVHHRTVATVALYAGLEVAGLALGLENANEMAYRQAVTPDRLLGRVNATMRSANRTAAAAGALLGGAAAEQAGTHAALYGVIAVYAAAAAVAALSPLRTAQHAGPGS